MLVVPAKLLLARDTPRLACRLQHQDLQQSVQHHFEMGLALCQMHYLCIMNPMIKVSIHRKHQKTRAQAKKQQIMRRLPKNLNSPYPSRPSQSWVNSCRPTPSLYIAL